MAECLSGKRLDHLVVIVALIVFIVPAAAVTWSWDTETLDGGYWSSIALDGAGNPRIAYTTLSTGDLKFAWMDDTGSWQTEPVDTAGWTGYYPSLKISSGNDIPEVSYLDTTTGKLKYAEKNPDTGWWNTIPDPDYSASQGTSLATDSSGRPHICYSSLTGLHYLYWDELGWHSMIVTRDGAYGSIALNSAGKPGISYWGSDQHLKYATIVCVPPHPPIPGFCTFLSETVDGSAYIRTDTSLAFDAGGNPHISYYDEFNHQLKYAVEDAGSWHITVIDSPLSFGYNGVSLALDSFGKPAISYSDAYGGLRFAWMDDAGWHTMTVDPGNDGDMPSLALDSAGNAHISYHASGILKYARGIRLEPIPFPGFPKSPTDPDRDGFYEDINGNGRLDFADIVLYFNQMEWIEANEPISAFDTNGNNRIDFADVVALFNEI